MKIPLLLLLTVLLIGCSSKGTDPADPNDTQAANVYNHHSDEHVREVKYEQWSKTIGEQFWPFSLKEYELQVDEADVVRGLGGRWITVRYLLREGDAVTSEEMAERVTRAFEYYGWKQTDLPEGNYGLSTLYERANADLHFTRGPFTPHDTVLDYRVTIHISDDASVVVLYCEAAW